LGLGLGDWDWDWVGGWLWNAENVCGI
jgi:hypothetical protein